MAMSLGGAVVAWPAATLGQHLLSHEANLSAHVSPQGRQTSRLVRGQELLVSRDDVDPQFAVDEAHLRQSELAQSKPEPADPRRLPTVTSSRRTSAAGGRLFTVNCTHSRCSVTFSAFSFPALTTTVFLAGASRLAVEVRGAAAR